MTVTDAQWYRYLDQMDDCHECELRGGWEFCSKHGDGEEEDD